VRAASVLKWIGIAIVSLLASSLAYNALTYINFDPSYSFLRLKQQAISTGWYLPAYYSHVLFGGLILLFGFFQMLPISLRFRRIHRAMGYFYVMGILFFAAPGGLVMSFFIDRGTVVLMSFLIQAILWFYCTMMAFNKIRNRDVKAHQQWMLRSYSLTFAAITLRVYIFGATYFIDLTQPGAYATLAWLSWLPNLIAVEFYIKNFSIKRARALISS
jgi:hypothetical protein